MQTDPHTAFTAAAGHTWNVGPTACAVQQEMVRCQRDARLKRLAKGGMSMLLAHAMLYEHRNAPRDTPDQLESFCANAPLERITSL